MLENVKNNIFTLHGALTTIIHLSIFVGILTMYILFMTQVMGHDVGFGVSSSDYYAPPKKSSK